MRDPQEARRRAEQRLAEARELATYLAGAQATVTSDDHAVTVTARPGGVVAALEISTRGMRLDPRALGRVIVETIREADARLAAEVAARAVELTGSDDVSEVIAGRLPSAMI